MRTSLLYLLCDARIVKLDLSEALKVNGVLGSVTALDVPGERNFWGLMIPDEEIFAQKIVQYHGQVIGGLVCKNKEIGEEALKKVVIEYEELPFILSLKHAQEVLNQNLDNLEILFQEGTLKRCQNRVKLKVAYVISESFSLWLKSQKEKAPNHVSEHYPPKGQLISKAIFVFLTSSKKRTKKI